MGVDQHHSVEWIAICPHGIFNLDRQLTRRDDFRKNRDTALAEWRELAA